MRSVLRIVDGDDIRILIRYSEDQERDDHGRFGSGGGGSDSGADGGSSSSDFDARVAAAISGQAALDAPPADRRSRYERSADAISLSREQADALDSYARDAQDINDELRTGTLSPDNAATVAALDSVMSDSTLGSDIVVYRGVTDTRAVLGDPGRDLVGTTVTEKAFVSTSADQRIAENFAGMFVTSSTDEPPTVMRVLAPEGTGAATISGWGTSGSALGSQAEIALDRGLTWTVVADHGVVAHPMVPSGLRTLDVVIES